MILPALLLAAAAPATVAPTAARSSAEDVADVSNRACLAWAAGELVLPHPAKPEYDAAVAALGLKPGMIRKSFDMLGPATALVSRAAMAYKMSESSYVVLAADGALPGCRVILLGEPSPGAVEAVAAALAAPVSGGWTAFPEMTESRASVTKRVFLRRDGRGKPYLLNLIAPVQPIGQLQLYTSVAPVPASVVLPKGF